MDKVSENTGKRICIYSDSGEFRLIATRRAITEDWNGVTHYYGSKWYIETHRRQGFGFVPYKFAGLSYIVAKKKELIDLLSRSVQFKQAYAELRVK
jgi:hypothetical protein